MDSMPLRPYDKKLLIRALSPKEQGKAAKNVPKEDEPPAKKPKKTKG